MKSELASKGRFVAQVGPEYVQTSGEPFVYYHKAFGKKQLRAR